MPHMIGEDGVMTLHEGQQLVLACPGKNNRLTVSGAEATLSRCAGGVMLNIENRQFPTYQLECENPVQGILQITSESCGCNNGNELRIGFQSPSESITYEMTWMNIWKMATYIWHLIRPESEGNESSHWINLVTSCHNLKKGETLYSSHIIYGTSLAGAEMKWSRPQFARGNEQLYPGFNPSHYYKKGHQRIIFTKMFGKRLTNKYLQDNFLSRGHLAPDADFLFGTWQYMTYYYPNSAPQWLSINSGNWQRVERCIRQFAISKRSNLLVTTGTHGILTLADRKKKQVKVYLHPEEKQLPVPKYFWKIVLDPDEKKCIGFICSNNPFLTRAPSKLCKDICSNFGWPKFEEFTNGYTYCCELSDLRKAIPTIPPIDCTSILSGQKN
ncbi:salivary endonuclease-like isoform X2 [Lycorma delicatula]